MTERTRSNVISIHRAKIKTMSVSVKALTLNNRQMTLSTFRQLLEEDLINHDGTLNGVPWGSVNYCPDKQCGGPEKHWHVVWQKGDELRRDTIPGKPNGTRLPNWTAKLSKKQNSLSKFCCAMSMTASLSTGYQSLRQTVTCTCGSMTD
jgi:hypothetical protein